MKIALFGLPACGKGTQAQLLKEHYGFEQLSTGDMLRQMRQQPGEIGDRLRALPVGTFADDSLILQAVKVELTDEKYRNGVIFDGFPRTAAQASAMLEMGVALDAVVYLKADEERLIERGVNRRVHLPSGRLYNLKSAPPKVHGLDDVTGEPLTWREDDKEEIMRRRFKDFADKTLPALDVLKEVCTPGSGPIYMELDAHQCSEDVFELLELELASVKAAATIRSGSLKNTVTIESPYAGDVQANEKYARAAMRDCLLRGEACFASHLLYTQPGVIDDTCQAQRRLGIEAGLLFAQMTAKTVVYTDLGISKGMAEGIAHAEKRGRPVEYRSLPNYVNELACGMDSFERELSNPNPPWAVHMLNTLRTMQDKALCTSEWRNGVKQFTGDDYVSAETLYHAVGGDATGWKLHTVDWDGGQHWYLKHTTGVVLDPTWHMYERQPDYTKGTENYFRDMTVSKSAQSKLDLAKWCVGYLSIYTMQSLDAPVNTAAFEI